MIKTDRTIAAISGNQITLDAPLTDSFDSSLLNPPGGSIIKYTFAGRIAQVGVEHLSVTAPAADVDISMPQFQALSMNSVINGWVQDVVVHDTDNSISIGGGTKQITLDHVTITSADIMGNFAWYRDTLGFRFMEWTVLDDPPDLPIFGMLTTCDAVFRFGIAYISFGPPALPGSGRVGRDPIS